MPGCDTSSKYIADKVSLKINQLNRLSHEKTDTESRLVVVERRNVDETKRDGMVPPTNSITWTLHPPHVLRFKSLDYRLHSAGLDLIFLFSH